MRELIYVSQAKLQQLAPGLPKRAGGLRDVEAEVNTPVGGFKVGKAAREAEPGLAAAVAALEASSRAPRWFAEPDVRPGQWVHFEAPMSYGQVEDAVLFIDIDRADGDYPTGGRLRLLLHGSVGHLVGAPPPGPDARSLRQALGPSRSWFHVCQALRALNREDPQPTGNDDHGHPADQVAGIVRGMDRLTNRLQPEHTAAWVAGYARVTAVIPAFRQTILAATPLYVEHVAPPGG
ncbi:MULTISPECIES: SAVMC3_10250 family protein [Amycolatopsis]|uniref:SAVMC3_10250 family protein n=1 Tax=Amycolatopsis TaxID=1813 RepID=UPI000B8B59A4|nr:MULTISPECIES: SAVMC3_10250 family protein [Amycolatopsis]OXM70160.1 hypothetical protein CF166_21380 [Amycolatopsis sp. KNN50.9b]